MIFNNSECLPKFLTLRVVVFFPFRIRGYSTVKVPLDINGKIYIIRVVADLNWQVKMLHSAIGDYSWDRLPAGAQENSEKTYTEDIQ